MPYGNDYNKKQKGLSKLIDNPFLILIFYKSLSFSKMQA